MQRARSRLHSPASIASMINSNQLARSRIRSNNWFKRKLVLGHSLIGKRQFSGRLRKKNLSLKNRHRDAADTGVYANSATKQIVEWISQRKYLLISSFISTILVITVFVFVPPSSIANIPLPDTYVPLLLLILLGSFSLSRLVLRTGSSIVLAILILFAVFCKLHHLVVGWIVWILLVLIFSSVWMLEVYRSHHLVIFSFSDILRRSKAGLNKHQP